MKTPSYPAHAKAAAPRYPRSPQVKVEITEGIFREAKLGDSSHCMIAEAIKAAYPAAKSVSVDLQTVRFSDHESRLRYIYLTPRIAQIALIEFDQGHDVEPFSFQLTGGHVIAMANPHKVITGTVIDQAQGAPKEIRVIVKRSAAVEKMNLAKQGLRLTGKGSVPERIGGKAPPTVPFGRRRAFGLRAIQK